MLEDEEKGWNVYFINILYIYIYSPSSSQLVFINFGGKTYGISRSVSVRRGRGGGDERCLDKPNLHVGGGRGWGGKLRLEEGEDLGVR